MELARIIWVDIPRFEIISNDGMWNRFRCIQEGAVSYLFNEGEGLVVFPVGWTTDFSSVPWWGRIFLPQLGPHSPAALLHDRALDLGWSRKRARRLMVTQLCVLHKVSVFRKWAMHLGVFAFDCALFLVAPLDKKKQN